MPENKPQSKPTDKQPSKSVAAQVADRIKGSENVLVALSKNPSVDELSAALGLTFILDKLGKHATAIFSGAVPNAIEFLEPEKTFEANTNSLQDFIIALDKEKADHLRYKIEGDFVKVFITPYRTTLSEADLEYSHGDYNVDLIVALNVDAEADLDSALSEYGKIKHDASSINISAAAPGKFGDLEWGDPQASSVSEMIVNLADLIKVGAAGEKLLDQPTATALLAGIVAATNRFSNERTTADTMSIASQLMIDGADQQLISSSIPVEDGVVDMNAEVAALNKVEETPAPSTDELVVDRTEEAPAEAVAPMEAPAEATTAPIAPIAPAEAPVEAPVAPEVAPAVEEELSAEKPANVPDLPSPEPSPVEPADTTPITQAEAPAIETIAVPAPVEAAPIDVPTPELEPLAEPVSFAPADAVPIVPEPVRNEELAAPITTPPAADFQPVVDPAVPPMAPVAEANAEYVAPPLPMPADGSVLPPPPAPFDMGEPTLPEPIGQTPPANEEPVVDVAATDFVAEPQAPVEPIMPAVLQEDNAPTPAASPSMNGVNPVMQDQVYNDPGAFKIPGM